MPLCGENPTITQLIDYQPSVAQRITHHN